jgi:beta-glucosidase-like glycosyl hydrolase/CubicO group peptidase (beta-lactamase class C family)
VTAAFAALALAASAGSTAARPTPVAPVPASAWARATLSRLSLAEKVGQMIGVRAAGLMKPATSADAARLRRQVKQLGAGTVVVFEAEAARLPGALNELQGLGRVPLLVAADLERGVSFRIRKGVVSLPYAMAIGATRSEEAARFTGEVTAREGRALGIHWAFAPVADVNNNPENPVINIRSYGEDPALVARLARAFVEGARSGGLLTTAKHFPGHGDTSTDSHLHMATIDAARERLNAVELLPFRSVVEAGVDSVMTGHIAAPALDPSRAPATVSSPMAEVLRRDLGFSGLIVTDGLDMAGVRGAATGEAAVRAVRAGADVILLPPRPEATARALVAAVGTGRIAESRIDASVLRILAFKERLGLDRERRVDGEAMSQSVARPQDMARAFEVAQASITVVRNEGSVLPLSTSRPLRVLHLVLSSDDQNPAVQGTPEEELRARQVEAETMTLGPELTEATSAEVVARASAFTHVLVSLFVRGSGAGGSAQMPERHARLLRALAASGKPLVVVSFGSPYLLRQVPEVPVYVATYGAPESSQRAAVSALFGEYRVAGKLPVSLPGLYAYGHGIELPGPAVSTSVSAAGPGLEAADAVVAKGVASRVFPGAVLAIGRRAEAPRVKAFGHLDYAPDSPAVREDTLYDLASLTKIVVTTASAMALVDDGKLDLERPVSAFLPAFGGDKKDQVTVWHLLTHSSGLDWWGSLYKDLSGPDAYRRHIEAMELVYEPGSKSLYSDLGVILLGALLERVAGEPLEAFARRRILDPLGMKDTLYRPGPELQPRIAPTEDDPWRGRVLRGEVHDENAFALGGVAPHAGLFGTAGDLARFAQMLLGGGSFEGRAILTKQTVERFARRAGIPASSRALGFDTPTSGPGPRSSVPGTPGFSSAGSLFSERSFGHTGFTGTSIWIDPARGVYAILLTNRVHPKRDREGIGAVRAEVADAVERAFEAAPSGGR